MRDKKFRQKILKLPPSPLFITFFLIPDFLQITEGFLYEVFGYLETTNFLWKIVDFSLLGIFFSDLPNFLKQRMVPLQNDSVPWDIAILMVNHDTGLLLPLTFFDMSFFLKHRVVPLRSFSVTPDNNLSTKNRDISILSIRKFDTRKKWNTTEGFSFNFFAHCDTKK